MSLIRTRDDWASQLAEVSARPYKNESNLRHGLYSVLHPYAIQEVGLQDDDIRHEGMSSSGRFDSIFGSTLIEYKTPGELETKAKRRHHSAQALRYVEDAQIGATIVILTDGRMWAILRDSEFHPDQLELPLGFVDEVPVPPEERFQWRENSIATAARVLDLIDTHQFLTPSRQRPL